MAEKFHAIALIIFVSGFATKHASAGDLIETATSAGNFKTFIAAAKTAGLTQTLKSSGSYTVFLPKDRAFTQLPPGTLQSLLNDKTQLAKVLNRHVIRGKMLIVDVKPGLLKTLEGMPVKLTSDHGKVTVNGANDIPSDMIADNGIIHEIDTVLLQQ